MKDVFISYKSEEIGKAAEIKSILEDNGISCWMAPECIQGGSSYAMAIPQALKQVRAIVLIFSSKAQTSQWVAKELDFAIKEGKVIFPLVLEDFELNDEFNFYLANVQHYNLYDDKKSEIEKLIFDIRTILERPEPKSEAKIPKNSKPKKNYMPQGGKPRKADRAMSVIGFILAVFCLLICLFGITDPYDFQDGVFFWIVLSLLGLISSSIAVSGIKTILEMCTPSFKIISWSGVIINALCLIYEIYVLITAF